MDFCILLHFAKFVILTLSVNLEETAKIGFGIHFVAHGAFSHANNSLSISYLHCHCPNAC